jgi:hypothetical protein
MYKIVTYYQENPAAIVSYRVSCRYYWAEHINYTRNLIISVLAGLADVPAITARLMKNQEDIGDLLRPYYDSSTVDEFVLLLKEHAKVVLDLVNASKANVDLTALKSDLQTNATAIVNWFNKVNSTNWSKIVVAPVWGLHLDLTLKEVQTRLAGEWEQDIEAYDNLHRCIIDFAEVFALGVVNQNLESFCK